MVLRTIILFLGLGLLATPAARAGTDSAERYRDARLEVRLLSEQRSLVPDTPLGMGIEFRLADGWHVYWSNPGDSGEAPSVRWELPAGFMAAPLRWPAPERTRTGPILNYAYSHSVLFPVDIDVPKTLSPGTALDLTVVVRWLACRAEECIPGEARLTKTLAVASASVPDAEAAAALARARDEMPQPRFADLQSVAGTDKLTIVAGGITRVNDATVEFFPLQRGVIKDASEKVAWTADERLRIELDRGELAPSEITLLPGLIVVSSSAGRQAFFVEAVPLPEPANVSLWLALLLALGGGAILNLMPCVFPVLSLKVLSFVEQAGSDPRRIRVHGWAFTLGVLASFWVLAGVLIALRAAGQSLGWGFQLQSPGFLAFLCATLLMLALSLSGVFEVGLSLSAMSSSRAEAMRGYYASFWTGALATLVATPCTAPFMGSALGYALTQPAQIGLLVFTALGLGMALPYLVLSYAPRLLARLPRPGAWMETFRQLMAFPLYATVLWLLHVFSRQTAPEAVWVLMAALLFLSMAAWTWGLGQRRSKGTRLLAAATPVLMLAAAAIAITAVRMPTPAPGTQQAQQESTADRFWQPWSPERLETLRAEGKPVFVNFTADWCLTCQVNERVVFSSSAVRDLFRSYGVVALEADWTNEDARIAQTLSAFGRDGVPLYVFYPSDGGAPRILPQVPTQASLREAFAASPQPRAPDPTKEKKPS